MSELVCLVADVSIEAVMQALLKRVDALKIKPIETKTYVHPNRDPGCFNTGAEMLHELSRQHEHGLLILDRAWNGCPAQSGEELLGMVRGKLRQRDLLGWADAVVIDPELEVWLFTNSPWLERSIGWPQHGISLRNWLIERGLWPAGTPKPRDPKRAIEEAMRFVGKSKSSSIYREIATRSTFRHCQDQAFNRLRNTLSQWFTLDV